MFPIQSKFKTFLIDSKAIKTAQNKYKEIVSKIIYWLISLVIFRMVVKKKKNPSEIHMKAIPDHLSRILVLSSCN